MTPKEFERARTGLGLNYEELAAILSVEIRTVYRWEQLVNGRPPNPMAVRMVEWMQGGFRPPQWPKRLAGQ